MIYELHISPESDGSRLSLHSNDLLLLEVDLSNPLLGQMLHPMFEEEVIVLCHLKHLISILHCCLVEMAGFLPCVLWCFDLSMSHHYFKVLSFLRAALSPP